jgi:hypothetical protein
VLATVTRLGFGLLTRFSIPARRYAWALIVLAAAQVIWLVGAPHYGGL